jgi:hypothetical protein
MPKEVVAICTIGAPKNTLATPNAQDQPAGNDSIEIAPASVIAQLIK